MPVDIGMGTLVAGPAVQPPVGRPAPPAGVTGDVEMGGGVELEPVADDGSASEEGDESAQTISLCVVCHVKRCTHAFVPCGHLSLCTKCSRRLSGDSCYICRAPRTGVLRIFV